MFTARTAFRAMLVATLCFFMQPAVALACSCAKRPACDSFWAAELVFIGLAKTVTRQDRKATITAQAVTLRLQKGSTDFIVQEWLRGATVGRQVVVTAKSDCDVDFEQGTRYLVHASRDPYGMWRAYICGGTSPVKDAFTDLKYIRDALAHPGPGTVSGDAFVDTDAGEPIRRGSPISNALVILDAGPRRLSARTDKTGKFRFDNVPPGNYTRNVMVPDTLRAVEPKSIVVGKGACVRDWVWAVRR